MIKRVSRFAMVLLIIVSFLLIESLVWVVTRKKWLRTLRYTKILTLWCRWACWTLNLHVTIPPGKEPQPHNGVLYVGNHLSYLDVITIAGRIHTCFVTSVEIKETPVLGQICQMAGCLFVERRSKFKIAKEIGELGEGLQHGLAVTIFPEATSTNGAEVLRFRRPLFLSAVQAEKPIAPICVNYRFIDGEPVTVKNRDIVFWYGDMDFVPHLWKVCGTNRIDVELSFFPVIMPKTEQDPAELAESSHAVVAKAFSPIRA